MTVLDFQAALDARDRLYERGDTCPRCHQSDHECCCRVTRLPVRLRALPDREAPRAHVASGATPYPCPVVAPRQPFHNNDGLGLPPEAA